MIISYFYCRSCGMRLLMVWLALVNHINSSKIPSISTEMVISIKTRICKGYPKVADQVVYWGVLKCCKPQGLLYAKPFTKPSSLYSMGVYLTICHNIPVVCPFFLALQGFGVLACAWHPHQPWLFTAGSDGRAYLWAWHAHIRKNPMRLLSSQPIATEQMWWRIKTPTGKRQSNCVFLMYFIYPQVGDLEICISWSI